MSANILDKWEALSDKDISLHSSEFSKVYHFLLKLIHFQKSPVLKYVLIEICNIILQYFNLLLIWCTNDISTATPLQLIVALFCSSTVLSFLTAHMHVIQGKSVLDIKTALNCVIVKKILKSKWNGKLEMLKNNSSKTLNLDIGVIQKCIFDFLSIICGLFDVIFSLFILYYFFGMYSFIAIFIFLLLTVATVVLINKRQKLQSQFRLNKEKRLRILSDILKVIKFLKMSALEEIFERKVGTARNKEIKMLKNDFFCASLQPLCRIIAPMLAIIGILNICLYFEACKLNPGKILIAISIIYSTSSRLLFLFNDFLDFIHGINAILIYANLWDNSRDTKQTNDNKAEGHISMQNCSFEWYSNNCENNVLKNLNLNIAKGELIIINGNVGSGKSTLLSAIYGDLKHTNGNLHNSFSHISFVPQVAWHRNGTWEDNIVFDRSVTKSKLENVVKCCSLSDEMVHQTTEITSDVSNISGGERARIALARVIYESDADLFLFDDILSSLDKYTAKHIFDSIIGSKGILKEKTRILVTNLQEFFKEADKVYTMKDGRLYEYNDFQMKKSVKLSLEDNTNAVREIQKTRPLDVYSTKEKSALNPIKILSSKFTVFGVLIALVGIYIKANLEFSSSNIIYQISFIIVFGLIYILYVLKIRTIFSSIVFKIYNGYLNLSKNAQSYVNIKIKSQNYKAVFNTVLFKIHLPFKFNKDLLYYLEKFSRSKFLLYICFALILNAGIDAILWVAVLNATTQANNISFSIFACVAKIILITISNVIFVNSVCDASKIFHERSLHAVLNSPLQYFLTINFSALLCIYSNDLEEIDTTIPNALSNLINSSFKLVVFFFTILTIYFECSWKLLIIPFILAYIVFKLVQRCQKYYIFDKLKSIQSEKYQSWNSILLLIDDTIKGRIVIKSSRVENNYMQKLYAFFDQYNLLNSMEHNCERNFTLLIDCITNISTMILLSIFVISQNVNDEQFKANLGLLFTCSLSFGETIRHISREWINLESGLPSISIFEQLINLPQEKDRRDSYDYSNIIKNGNICFKNFSFGYSNCSNLQLENINCTIQSVQKVAIVGRTGAGKSSLFNAILRLFNGHIEGCLFIDGIPINRISLTELRRKIGIIPQDPVLFPGTLRENLDIHNKSTDKKILEILKLLNLTKFSKKAILDEEISSDDISLSHGEKQLICIARALLNPDTKILLIDEGTAAVDKETDLIVQESIEKYFKTHTILKIAHQFETIKECDSVIVMNNGKLIEYDTLENLLNNKESFFNTLFSFNDSDKSC